MDLEFSTFLGKYREQGSFKFGNRLSLYFYILKTIINKDYPYCILKRNEICIISTFLVPDALKDGGGVHRNHHLSSLW